MKRENISRILNGIDPSFVDECARMTLPPERSNMKKQSVRRLVVLASAACLIFATLLTGYATGAFDSILSRVWSSYAPGDPESERAKGRDDYADWLETQHETREAMLEIGANMQQEGTFVSIPGRENSGITLLESFYDGERIALGCRFHGLENENEIEYDVPVEGLEFTQLPIYEDYRYVFSPEDLALIDERLSRGETVTLRYQDSWLRDHIYANGQDLGPCHSDVDSEGYFTVEPLVMGIGEVVLDEKNRDVDEITVTMNYAVGTWVYQITAEQAQYSYQYESYPIEFTIQNGNRN